MISLPNSGFRACCLRYIRDIVPRKFVRSDTELMPWWITSRLLEGRRDEALSDHLLCLGDDVLQDLAGGLDLVDEAGALAGGLEGVLGVEVVGAAHVVHHAVLHGDGRLHREGLDLVRLAL